MYLLFYSKSCIPHVKQFKSKKAAITFAKEFLYTYEDNTDDNWVDFLIKGKIDKKYSGSEGIAVE